LVSVLSSQISEFDDALVDEIEMVVSINKPLKMEEILDVVIPQCNDEENNLEKEDNIADFWSLGQYNIS
jgi:hypothetical protein